MINDADGSRYPTQAVYDEVVEPERLVWTEAHSGMTVTVTFTDLGGSRTGVEIHQVRVPEAFRSPEAQAGFLTSLDRFAGYLAARAAALGRRERDDPRAGAERGDHRRRSRPSAGSWPRSWAACRPESWDSPTLCAGWRVREVVAHITMPFRYRPPRFAFEMVQVARELQPDGRPMRPPGRDRPARRTRRGPAGQRTEPVEAARRRLPGCADPRRDPRPGHHRGPGPRPPGPRGTPGDRPGRHHRREVGPVLRHRPRAGIELRADDLDWSFGSGTPVSGSAQDLALVVCGRKLPPGHLRGEPSARFTGISGREAGNT